MSHSVISSPTITPIPAFVDNYIWALHDAAVAVVVDPGDARPVQAFLASQGLKLAGILVTHHHWDHVNGIEALLAEWPGIPVWGPAQETIPQRSHALSQGDSLTLPLGVRLEVMELPGHTLGHIGYFCADLAGSGPVVFCGDTLFSSGCGRLFEGTPEQMYDSLSRLAALPAQTRVCCTHEYTRANLAFAAAVEPDNAAISARIQQVDSLRAQGKPSLPSTLALELQVNPFLRSSDPTVISAVSQNCGVSPADSVDTFAKLRLWKDRF